MTYPGEIVTPKRYGISSELGEIETVSHTATTQGKVVYNSGEEFFEKTASREKFKSGRFKELALDYATDTSIRGTTARLNRIRLETNGVIPTTYRNIVEREGSAIQAQMHKKCEQVFHANGFDSKGGVLEGKEFKTAQPCHIAQPIIEKAAINLNIWDYNASDYEEPSETVNISIDDVGVNRQTETRPRDDKNQQPKRVNNTVIHIQSNNNAYILNESSMFGSIKLLIGFLLYNGLMHKQIVIFADGARDIHNAIAKMLPFANYKIILDWYHLQKKCKEQLSMALKGRLLRNEFLEELLPCLWFGNVKGAIKLLENIDTKKVKNHEIIISLIEYLQRVQVCIPNYALRKELGLRNSSNLGEKANDIVVSNRQKHNGMSWSIEGSTSFASVASASFNGELQHWIHERDIYFRFVAPLNAA